MSNVTIEYIEVDRATVDDLNNLGEEGWKPGGLRWEEGYRPVYDPNYFVDGGWTGLLYREGVSDAEVVVAESIGVVNM